MDGLQSYPNGIVSHLDELGSDRSPRLPNSSPRQYKRRGCFTYDQRWVRNAEANLIVLNCWSTSQGLLNLPAAAPNGLCAVERKIKASRSGLFQWARTRKMNANRNIESIKQELSSLHQQGFDQNAAKIKDLEVALAVEVSREEQYWHQKARVKWLRWGDKNTSYFRAEVVQRRRRNNICQLQNKEGVLCKEETQIVDIAVDYFKNIYSSSNPSDIREATSCIMKRVTPNMNRSLTRPFTDDEIRRAAFAINPDKAPGQDGMTGLFFQTHWDTISGDICSAVKEFFGGNRLPRALNHTTITLVPKVGTPLSMSDLRPISLCPVFYKIISGILTNRLQRFMPDLIRENQSALVKGRNISDNILLAHELTHHLKTKKGGTKFELALKLDMSKAYERIEWIFVKRVMRKMGFHHLWIRWVMSCISTVTYSLKLNGASHGFIKPSRGLRQGDPLSPFLFLLCAECFSSLLTKAEITNSITGVQISKRSPNVSHLLFADDSLLFFQATSAQAKQVTDILKLYCRASGQEVNLNKSSILFSNNTPSSIRQQLALELNVRNIGGQDRYLGLPALINKPKAETFREICQKVRVTVANWKGNLLSHGGREVLIKSIATAVPVFSMSCFLLPKSIHKEINKIISNFWWGQKNGERRMHWVSWKKMCLSKEKGGLGFRDLEQFNRALLAKQGWRLLSQPKSLISKVLKGKYFPHNSFLEAKNHSNESWAWKSILMGRKVLDLGVRWQVRSGTNIFIHKDPWIPTNTGFGVNHSAVSAPHIHRVSDLMEGNPRSWNTDLVKELFIPETANSILKMPISSTGQEDRLVWHYSNSGSFSVKSAYHIAMSATETLSRNYNPQQPPGLPFNWNIIWKLHLPPNIKIFIWRALSDGLASNDNLSRRLNGSSALCPRCNAPESVAHLLIHCPFVETVWLGSGICYVERFFESDSLRKAWDSLDSGLLITSLKLKTLSKVVWIMWSIWLARNGLIFRDEDSDPSRVLSNAVKLQNEFEESNRAIQNVSHHRPSSGINQQEVQWSPPPVNSYKVNFDGAFRANSSTGVGACVVRDHWGRVISSCARRFNFVTSPALVEALALREAIYLAAHLKLTAPIFEGDAKDIIDAMNGDSQANLDCEVILLDCKTLCSTLSPHSFSFVRRSCNWVADSIAKKALRDSLFCNNPLAQMVWLDSRLCSGFPLQ